MSDFMKFMSDIFSLPFVARAFVVGILIAVCSSLLGVSLVLKRYSMIGDGLSHVGFGALAIAAALNLAPLKVAIPIVILTAFLLLRINESGKIKGDSAIAMVSSCSLALGVLIVSISHSNVDLNSYLFGSIYAIAKEDMYLSIILSIIVIGMYILFYNKIFAVTFDENFARATGAHATTYNMVMACLTAITVVVGMKLVGSLLISSLIIFPPITSMHICKTFKNVVFSSIVVSVLCVAIGIITSFMINAPASSCIVLANLLAYLLFYLIGSVKGKLKRQYLG